jgi:hypothetical protein
VWQRLPRDRAASEQATRPNPAQPHLHADYGERTEAPRYSNPEPDQLPPRRDLREAFQEQIGGNHLRDVSRRSVRRDLYVELVFVRHAGGMAEDGCAILSPAEPVSSWLIQAIGPGASSPGPIRRGR